MESVPPFNQNITALIVDDQSEMLNLLTSMLRNLKIKTILQATNGQDAVDIIKKNKVDLVFLDILMKGLCGVETLKAIKETNPDLYVIMLSGEARLDIVKSCLDLGANSFVKKPFTTKKIISVLTKYTAAS